MNMVRENRVGRFSIPRHTIMDCPEIIAKLLAGSIVIRAELQWTSNTAEYTAYHPDFPQVAEGVLPPHYPIDSTSKEYPVYSAADYYLGTTFKTTEMHFNTTIEGHAGTVNIVRMTEEEHQNARDQHRKSK